ncbi:hypothetical protein H6G64_32415 [Calothrix sp. FACHB-156]|nr:hypothetical protein [Calothrix sp. FACHB-156]
MIERPLTELINHCQQLLKQINQHPDYKNLIAKGHAPDLTLGDAQTALTYLNWQIESTRIIPELNEIIAINDEAFAPPAKKKANAPMDVSTPQNIDYTRILPVSKPIGYYTSYTPGKSGLLENLQQQWGATFEKMTRQQKLYLVVGLALNLSSQYQDTCQDTSINQEIASIPQQVVKHLSTSDQEGLLEALVAQIRYQ